jgi:hypothetical protein
MNKIQNHVALLMILDRLMLVKFSYIHVYARNKNKSIILILLELFTSSSSFRLCLPIALGTPADRLPTDIPYHQENEIIFF